MAKQTETPVLDLLTTMTAASIEATELDTETLILVRLAALIAVDAPPASYLLTLGASDEVAIDEEKLQAVFTAVAPIVGTTKVVSAAGKIVRALGLATDLAELEAEEDAAS